MNPAADKVYEAPDPYAEFGVDSHMVNILPEDFFPSIQHTVEMSYAQYRDQLMHPTHTNPHFTALRQLLNCSGRLQQLFDQLQTLPRDDGQAEHPLAAWLNQRDALAMRKALWFHWASLTFGDNCVVQYIVSLATWLRTPAPYRTPNAPILTTMPPSCSRTQSFRRTRSPSPRRRSPSRSSPRRRSKSPK
uniref:Core protein n=1 Tax=Hepatitis B virus TaxID=10407 RepID=A0A8F3CIN2_HBV|nr:MAG: core protein [Hepatitis B virus]